MTDLGYCSDLSSAAEEPLYATASLASRWVLVEIPGPWEHDALSSKGCPEDVRGWIEPLRTQGVRVVFIRKRLRPGGQTTIFFVRSNASPSLQWLCIDSFDELGSVDMQPFLEGGIVPLLPIAEEPVILVCTHGRHDLCCSIKGNAVARALEDDLGESVWECSHIGGDRFAPNVVVLPQGAFFGRLRADDAGEVMQRFLAGEIDLDHYRGRSGLGFAIQAAEYFLRRELGETRRDALLFDGRTVEGDRHRVRWSVGGRAHEVVVRKTKGTPRRLTCKAEHESRPTVFELEGILSP